MRNRLAASRNVGIGRLNLLRCLRLHSSRIQKGRARPNPTENVVSRRYFAPSRLPRDGFGWLRAPPAEMSLNEEILRPGQELRARRRKPSRTTEAPMTNPAEQTDEWNKAAPKHPAS